MTQYARDVTLQVNGDSHTIHVEPRRTLADALRDNCGLTGTHLGCEHGVCGACTVLIDGDPVRACLVFAVFWNARRFLDNACYLFIGIAYLFVAAIDLTHTLALEQMNIFRGFTDDLAIQLWIVARYVQSLSLIAAMLFIGRRIVPGGAG